MSSVSNTLAGWSAAGRGPDKIIVFATILNFFSKSDLMTDIILQSRLYSKSLRIDWYQSDVSAIAMEARLSRDRFLLISQST